MKKFICAQLVALTGTLFAISTASAASTSYAGNACVSTPLSASNYSIWYGTVANSSTTAELSVNCAAPRHGTRISSATVQVYDRNTTVNVSCTLSDYYANSGGYYLWSSTVTSSGYGTAPQTLSFGALSYAGSGLDSYNLQCSIPRSESGVSHVIMYTLNES